MNSILIHLQHNFDFHMDHSSTMATNIIGSIFDSDSVVFEWREREMHNIIHRDKPWILCTCKADTPKPNLHRNIQPTECQTKPDLAAAPATILENPDAAVAAPIEILVARPRAAAATMANKTLPPVAVGLTTMRMADDGTNLEAIIALTRPRTANRWVIAMTMAMYCDPHVEVPAY